MKGSHLVTMQRAQGHANLVSGQGLWAEGGIGSQEQPGKVGHCSGSQDHQATFLTWLSFCAC